MRSFLWRGPAVACLAILLVLASGGAASAAGTSGSSPTSPSSLSGTLNVYEGGDVNIQKLWQDALIPDFEKAYPKVHVNFVFSAHGVQDSTTLAKLASSKQTGQYSGFDLLDSGLVTEAAQAGLLTKVTTKEVARSSQIDPQSFLAAQHDAMPYRGSKVLIAYDTQNVKHAPKTLKDVLSFIKSNPGKFDYNVPSGGGSGQAFIEAVLNQYVPTSDQRTMALGYDTSLESGWSQGFTELHSLNTDIYQNGTYPASQTQVYQELGSGTIWMAPVWSDQGLAAKKSGEFPSSVKFAELNPPLYGGPAYLGVPAVTPHKQLAFAFMNFVLSGKEQQKIVSTVQGLPGVELKYTPKSVQKEFSSYGTSQALPYSSKTAADMNRLWQSKVPG